MPENAKSKYIILISYQQKIPLNLKKDQGAIPGSEKGK